MRIKIQQDEPHLESIPESPVSLNPEDNEMPTEPTPPRIHKKYLGSGGISITNLGTIQEFGNETPNLYSPDRQSLESQSPNLASLRLARMLLGGGYKSPYLSSRTCSKSDFLDMEGVTTPNKGIKTPNKGITTPNKGIATPNKGVTTPKKLFGFNLAERVSGLKSEREVLQDRVDELQEIVRKQNKEEQILQNKVRYLEDLVDHMTSNKIVLAEETSKALSTLRVEFSKFKLCNTQKAKSSGDTI